MTLSRLIDLIELFGIDHQKVDTVFFGERYLVDDRDSNGVVQWFAVAGSTINGTEQLITFNVSFMDVLLLGMENELDIYSDTYRVCEDFLAYMEDASYDYGFQVERSSTFSPFVHTESSDYAGYDIQLTVKIPHEFDYCTPSVDAVTVSDKGVTVNSVSQLLSKFATRHLSVGHAEFSSEQDLDDIDTNGAVMIWYVNDSTISGTTKTIGFNVLVLDVLDEGEGNKKDILNDTLRVGVDLIAYLENYASTAGYNLTKQFSLTPKVHMASSDYYGWLLPFTIEGGYDYDVCDMSMDRCIINDGIDWVVDHLGNRILA